MCIFLWQHQCDVIALVARRANTSTLTLGQLAADSIATKMPPKKIVHFIVQILCY